MKFTGERFVPGQTSLKIEADHLARYAFACRFARGKRVLDIACGVGYGSKMLADAGAKAVDGVDIAEDAIRYARGTYPQPGVTFIRADICRYESEPAYDLIVCFETIEHIRSYREGLRNLKSLLSAEGRLLISSPNRPITSPRCTSLADRPGRFHFQEFTIPELTREMTHCGLAVAGDVLGQRQQYYLPHPAMRWLYNICLRPHKWTSPRVSIVRNKIPRYFILTATHPENAAPGG